MSQKLMICAAPSYLQEHGVPRPLTDLGDHWNIVGMRRGPPVTWLVHENGIKKRIAPPPTHQLSDGDAIIEAAVAGFGICQMPSSVVRQHLEAEILVPILEDYSQASINVHAIWARQGQLSPKVRYIVDRLVRYAEGGRLS